MITFYCAITGHLQLALCEHQKENWISERLHLEEQGQRRVGTDFPRGGEKPSFEVQSWQ